MGIISSKPKQNLIINGDQQISQRFVTGSITSIASGSYMTDRFQYVKSGTMVHNAQQIGDAPSDTQSGQQFINSLNLALTTPDTSIAAGDLCLIQQKIEGYNFSKIARTKTFTLSFWVKAVLTGTYCVAFQNSAADRSYVAEYTIDVANTWEFKKITVNTPTPSGGTWNYTNGVGLGVVWTIAAGTTYQTTAGAWNTGNFVATSNQINGVNTGANDFRITGIMLNEGNNAQPFKTYGDTAEQELLACQRYYEKSFNITDVPVTNSGILSGAHSFPNLSPSASQEVAPVTFKATKRATPTVTMLNPSAANNQIRSIGGTPGDWSSTTANPGQTGFALGGQSNATASGATCKVHWVAEAEL